jgi:hypothetical protein
MSQHSDEVDRGAPATIVVSTPESLAAVVTPSSTDVARIQELLSCGDVAAAELALKQLKKQLKRDFPENKKERKKDADVVAILEGDERKDRRAYEKDQKRAREDIEKLARDSFKNTCELEQKRLKEDKKERERIEKERKDEKRERDRVDKERRELDRQLTEERKDILKDEKSAREEIERERKQLEKSYRDKERKPNVCKARAAPVRSLISYGFSAEKRKGGGADDTLLFSQFVPAARHVPPRLAFWGDNAARELSLSQSTPPLSSTETSCHGPDGFCKEVVFSGFSAIGFEPAQARPSYWGTMNPMLNDTELLTLARYPLGSPMPQVSTLNYDCDSGDDWDVMDSDDDDVDASDDEEGESDSSADGSEDSFIDDDACSDSDNEQVSSFINARARRQNRLRGKDRLVPTFTGPFEGLSTGMHPLNGQSHFVVSQGLTSAFIEEILLGELSKTTAAHIVSKPSSQIQRYRQVGEDELGELREFISHNPRTAVRSIMDSFAKRPSFAGIANSELRRTLKRFFEHKCGVFMPREEPWSADDPRLFEKKISKNPKVTTKPQDFDGTPDPPQKRERSDEIVTQEGLLSDPTN